MEILTQNHFKMFGSWKFSFHSKISLIIWSGNSNKSQQLLPLFHSSYHFRCDRICLSFLNQGTSYHFTQEPKTPTSSEGAKQLNSIKNLTIKIEIFIFES